MHSTYHPADRAPVRDRPGPTARKYSNTRLRRQKQPRSFIDLIISRLDRYIPLISSRQSIYAAFQPARTRRLRRPVTYSLCTRVTASLSPLAISTLFTSICDPTIRPTTRATPNTPKPEDITPSRALRPFLESFAGKLNKTARIFDTFLIQYSIPTLEVHAEVRVLEYFYKTQRSFAGYDRFIACSKPACLCCEMYFRYHPARMVVPSPHRKIWTKWSPPLVEQYDNNNPAARQQKHILNKMTQNLCEQVITHVLQRFPPSRWHPDSITNITDLRRCGISSDSLEVPDAESSETTPSMFSQEHQIRSNNPTEDEQGSSDAEADFQAFDSENGGVSLFGYT